MLPKINNKTFMEVDESDLIVLVDNPDYRESDYLDYKEKFSFLEILDKKEKEKKVFEFRNDICAFANADGGYLIYGISDENGCAKEIIGIDIEDDNTDKFELDRRNNLTPILPKQPKVFFHFVKLSNGKYVVIIFIKKDSFAPYIHLVDEKDYKIYRRNGNQKKVMTYSEMKNMFNQSLSLEKEMYNYRIDRIGYFKNQEDTDEHHYSQFMMIHFIPETFMDSSYNQNIFALHRVKGINFNDIFSPISCNSVVIPNADGIRCVPNVSAFNHREGSVKNNGIVECFIPLVGYINCSDKYPKGHLGWKAIWWECIEAILYKYCDVFANLNFGPVYVSVSIVGCKDVTTDCKEFNYIGKIDRNQVLCNAVLLEDMVDRDKKNMTINKLYADYLMSIGVKYDDDLITLLKELYK